MHVTVLFADFVPAFHETHEIVHAFKHALKRFAPFDAGEIFEVHDSVFRTEIEERVQTFAAVPFET